MGSCKEPAGRAQGTEATTEKLPDREAKLSMLDVSVLLLAVKTSRAGDLRKLLDGKTG